MNSSITVGPYEGILLLGGGEILRNICIWALPAGFNISVVTSERHSKEVINGTTLSSFLQENNISYLVTNEISSTKVKKFIGNTDKIFCLSLGAAWIFNSATIKELFNNKLFNLHGTRLPQNRGGGGWSWQIMTANRFGFSILHLVDEGVDTGSIVMSDEYLYPATCRLPIDYENIYVKKNTTFLINFLNKYSKSSDCIELHNQTEYFSTYWPRLNSLTNSWIDWSMEKYDLERFICAFDDPYQGAQTYICKNKVYLKKVSLNFQDGVFNAYQSGLIYRKTEHWACVCIAGASLIIEQVIDESGDNIISDLNVGDRFITPTRELENAKNRVVYTPSGMK